MKAKNMLISVLTVLLILALAVLGFFLYKDYFAKNTSYIGTWTRKVDVSSCVREAMDEYLSDADLGGDVSYGNNKVTISVNMTLSSDGTYTVTIPENSYEEAQAEALAFAKCGLYSFLEKRLEATGTTVEATGKTVEELFDETVGMNAEEYITLYCPALLPTEEELKNLYEQSGTYTVEGDTLTRITGSRTLCENVLLSGDTLVLTDEKNADTVPTVSLSAAPATEDEPSENYPVLYERK